MCLKRWCLRFGLPGISRGAIRGSGLEMGGKDRPTVGPDWWTMGAELGMGAANAEGRSGAEMGLGSSIAEIGREEGSLGSFECTSGKAPVPGPSCALFSSTTGAVSFTVVGSVASVAGTSRS